MTMMARALDDAFRTLSAEALRRSAEAAQPAEVVSMSMAGVVKLVDQQVERFSRLRIDLLNLTLWLDGIDDHTVDSSEIDAFADALASMRRFRALMSKDYAARGPDGFSWKSWSELLRSIELKRPGDGRLLRRLAKRIEEIVDPCEIQRKRLLGSLDAVIGAMEKGMSDHGEAVLSAIGRKSVNRTPRINEYLAR